MTYYVAQRQNGFVFYLSKYARSRRGVSDWQSPTFWESNIDNAREYVTRRGAEAACARIGKGTYVVIRR